MSSSPNLTQLRVQAKELLRAVRAGDPDALRRVLVYFDQGTELRLSHAQLVIARENGFASWARLKHSVEHPVETNPTTTFFAAVESGDIDEARAAIANIPELVAAWRKTDYGGWESALHVASSKGNLEMARMLVDSGAQVYATQQSDYPPIFAAHYSGNRELVDFLLEASRARDNGQPPTYGCGIDIVVAARVGMVDRVRMHIERDPFAVYRRGCIGESVLHWPAHNSFPELVSLLLDAGAHIEADEIGLYGGKPLHWASEHAPSCVAVLLERGANPNSRNLIQGEFQGFTPLHMCASQRDQCIECAELLLAAGADPTLRDAQNRTPLEVARDHRHEKMTAFLERR